MTVLTPSLHCNDYCEFPNGLWGTKTVTTHRTDHACLLAPDDHRFDMRPFLYPLMWKNWSFKKIDIELAKIEKQKNKRWAS